MVKGKAAARRYLRKVRRWLPCTRKMRNGIMEEIEKNVISYVTENPDACFYSLTRRFGTPQQIAAGYVDNMGTMELLRDLRIKKKIYMSIFTVFSIALIMWLGCITLALTNDYNADNGYIVEKITNIEYAIGE